jgi:peptidoglycan/LPS O-acetylase OafA/YrhL
VTHEIFAKTSRFGSLDGLRALSILMVLWHHTAADGYLEAVVSRLRRTFDSVEAVT